MNRVDQVIIGATPGDAITDEAFLIQRWLQTMGFASEIFAQYIHPALEKSVQPMTTWRSPTSQEWVIYHHSIGSFVADLVIASPAKLILIYHNITPPEFFTAIHPTLSNEMVQGRAQLLALRVRASLALADSSYNEQDLIKIGFYPTGVLPIALDEASVNVPVNPDVLARYDCACPSLLFVGRQVPNKKQEDLIKLLYYYRRIEPRARLFLIGDAWVPAYTHWLHDLAADLGLDDAVIFAGKTSQHDLVTYYHLATLYVSMSEHEGFGKPLIESMYLGLPVMAFAATAVPGTLGDAGVLFHHKDYEALAELVDILARDETWRRHIVARQRERVSEFLAPQVRRTWQTLVGEILD